MVLTAAGAEPPGECFPSFSSSHAFLVFKLPQTVFPSSKKNAEAAYVLGTSETTSH